MTNNEKNKFNFAVVFDMDGVIVDSNPVHVVALKQYCQKLGLSLSEEFMEKNIFGRTNRDWLYNVFQGNITEEEIRYHSEEKERLFRKLFEPIIKPVKGLVDFLKLLKANRIRIALATSAIAANVDFVLEKTCTKEFFDLVVDESFVNEGKPDPEIYLKTAQLLELPPGKCVVFEDSFSGVEAARRAGCKVVAVTTTHRAHEFQNVDIIINNFDDISISDIEKLFK